MSQARIKLCLLAVGLGVGGTEAHVLELASRIDRSRFDVVVCSLKSEGGLAHELRAHGVRVMSLGGRGKIDLRIIARLRAFLQVERPDVIQAFLFWANVAVRAFGRHGRPVVISSYHDEVVREGWLTRLIDRLTMPWTHRIVCCSQAVLKSVQARIGGKGRAFDVIPFGVETERFARPCSVSRSETRLDPRLPVLGTICRLVEPKKGLRFLLEAIACLEHQARKPICQLLIVGGGPAREDLERQIKSLGIGDRVVFAGERRDIPELLSVMDIFVLPSLYEGFGIAILEAMAAGKPVVATTVGGIPEFVVAGQAGLLVQPGNAEALAGAIKQLLDDPDKARAMGLQGREHVKQYYSIESVVRQHEQLYERCLAQV